MPRATTATSYRLDAMIPHKPNAKRETVWDLKNWLRGKRSLISLAEVISAHSSHGPPRRAHRPVGHPRIRGELAGSSPHTFRSRRRPGLNSTIARRCRSRPATERVVSMLLSSTRESQGASHIRHLLACAAIPVPREHLAPSWSNVELLSRRASNAAA